MRFWIKTSCKPISIIMETPYELPKDSSDLHDRRKPGSLG